MKIIVTGKVKSGKTTLLNRLLAAIDDKRGMAATEFVENGQRTAFNLLDDTGRTAVLAQTSPPTDIPVGRFFVNRASLDAFIEPLFTFRPNQLLYIDEIGHMQLTSEKFQKLVRAYLDTPNDYLGTISSIYEHPCITEVTNRHDVLLCTLTPENREPMLRALNAALHNRGSFNGLPADAQDAVLRMARSYLRTESYISLRKLFHNAIVYVAENRVKEISGNSWTVQGNHGQHHVSFAENTFSCDCDLFHGRAQFAGKAGECSHIQAIKIL